MIRIAVFDSDPDRRAAIKRSVSAFTIQNSVDLDVFWFTQSAKVDKYASLIHIALISLDDAEGSATGRRLYGLNEDCRIVYYSASKRELIPLLSVRPRGFCSPEVGGDLMKYIGDIVGELKKSSGFFYHETRRELYLLPYRSILYFQSDLKYVNIYLRGGGTEKLYAKLSEIEKRLGAGFLRLHKSYIVNTSYVQTVDKSDKAAVLCDGETIPVSDANYKQVLNYFSERNNNDGL